MGDNDIWNRLRRVKYILLSLAIVVAALVLSALAQHEPLKSFDLLPIKNLSDDLFTAGVVGVGIALVDALDAEKRTRRQFRAAIKDETPAIRDSVLSAFSATPQDFARVLSPDSIDQALENFLALRLGNPSLAKDLCTQFSRQVARSTEFCLATKVNVTLTPWRHDPHHGQGSLFVATIQWEGQLTSLARQRRLACASDEQTYQELRKDPSMDDVWKFPSVNGLTAATPGVFEVVRYAVNGQSLPVAAIEHPGAQIFAVTLPENDAGQVHISYQYRGLMQRHGHKLFIDIPRPCQGIQVDFTHRDCGIQTVDVDESLAIVGQAHVFRSAADAPTPVVSVGYDGWVLPRKSALTFTWTLDSELDADN